MTVRAERNALAGLIRRYLGDEITAFEFDERLQEFYQSKDATVRHVAFSLWFHYDDCKDHYVVLTKRQWDYFQRLLLLLESDARVLEQPRRRVVATQLIAAALLTTGVLAAWFSEMSWPFWAYLLPMWIGSVGISLTRAWLSTKHYKAPYYEVVFPFSSITDLKTACDSVSFRKQRYPRQLSTRKVRSERRSRLMLYIGAPIAYFYWLAAWWIASPLVLVFQCSCQASKRDEAVVVAQ